MQFSFNMCVEESIVSTRRELEKMVPSDAAEKASVKKASEHFDKGASTLKKRQKHIKVADRSEYGWRMVRHYQSDLLASDSEDEKELHRAEKDAKKDFEQLEVIKRRRGGGAWRKCPSKYHLYANNHQDVSWDGNGPSSTRGTPPAPRPLISMIPHKQVRHRALGPCFHCGGVWPPGGIMPYQRTTVSFCSGCPGCQW